MGALYSVLGVVGRHEFLALPTAHGSRLVAFCPRLFENFISADSYKPCMVMQGSFGRSLYLTSVLICEICGYILGFQPQLTPQFTSPYALYLAHFNTQNFCMINQRLKIISTFQSMTYNFWRSPIGVNSSTIRDNWR
jgi:hypothetical protein